MDTRDSPEQAELRRSARRLARDLGPQNVSSLGDATRATRLTQAAREAGWLQLRSDDGAGQPFAGSVEAGIVAEALGSHVADLAFAGPVLAADLARRAHAPNFEDTLVAYSPSLSAPAVVSGPTTTEPLHAIDGGDGFSSAWVFVPDGNDFRLGRVPLDGPRASGDGADLTRAVLVVPAGTPVKSTAGGQALGSDDLAAWTALGLALTSADLVGVMRGVLDVTVDYASQRKQYGVSVGSFQAVQHLLAEARCLMEGSLSIALHAAWAVDDLAPEDARAAGRVAKAYCARAAQTVCETAVQVHGGIGNTWDCIVHVYLRRALLSRQWFGDDGSQLLELGPDGLEAV
ncbi:MAG: acyl-CoA dehydrogenase family protein [Candidatus Binatia bacterium]|nr:acyl-CoA dehydrogenase family protein [Candidatus Binatia bacterium]